MEQAEIKPLDKNLRPFQRDLMEIKIQNHTPRFIISDSRPNGITPRKELILKQ